jgi:hypothetical protein
MRVYVQGMVYFPSPGATVHLRSLDPEIPVFCPVHAGGGPHDAVGHPQGGRVQLGRETREKILALLRESK